MLRSVLVALDDTKPSAAAQELSIRLAERFNCELTGLAVLDRKHITAPAAVGIGGASYKHHRDQVKLEEAKSFLERLENQFRDRCVEQEINHQIIEAEGVPHQLLARESARHDLLVIGRDTDFHFDVDAATAEAVLQLLKENPRPLVVCPEAAPAEGAVLVAYDGSPHASRTLHMFALLGPVRDVPVHVVSVDDDPAKADACAEVGTALLAKHGYEAVPHGVGSGAKASDIILAEADALNARLVAIGTSGHNFLHDLLLGSTTQRLMEACPCPLFVYH